LFVKEIIFVSKIAPVVWFWKLFKHNFLNLFLHTCM